MWHGPFHVAKIGENSVRFKTANTPYWIFPICTFPQVSGHSMCRLNMDELDRVILYYSLLAEDSWEIYLDGYEYEA